MKETILSNAEKAFVLQAISQKKRLDGRDMDECRKLEIMFGTEWGCCMVSLGKTKVLAQASCEVTQPKATRPNEGLLFLNIELSPMGAPHFEPGRQSELGVQLNRLLEKCIKDSRCVDLESLCIVTEEKVWALRVDINVLNHEGNLVDAASVAALTALWHFRRPDVTTEGEQIVVHNVYDRDPIPITLHHHPMCVTYAIFNKGKDVVADPTVIEERVSESQLVYGMNAYRELCGLHLGGSALSNPDIVVYTSARAAKRAADVFQLIKAAIEKDKVARDEKKPLGFAEITKEGKLLALSNERLSLQLDSYRLRDEAQNLVRREEDAVKQRDEEPSIIALGGGSAELLQVKEEGSSAAALKSEMIKQEEDSEEEMSDSSEIEVVKEISFEERLKFVDSIELSGDSEEEDTVMLKVDDLGMAKQQGQKKEKQRNWYPNKQW